MGWDRMVFSECGGLCVGVSYVGLMIYMLGL
jgi:hypothetical protein